MSLRVAQVGTFDVPNFGDLLFPLLARHELERRLGEVELVPYSLGARDTAEGWPFEVRAVDRLAEEVAGFDLLLVGGGDIVRFDAWAAPGYAVPETPAHHPTALWAGASITAAAARVPVAWNAPGVVRAIDSSAAPLTAAASRSAAYLSVRDEASAARLRRADAGLDPVVAPDSASGIRALVPERPSAALLELLGELGLEPPYVVVQPAPALAPIAAGVRSVAEHLAAQRTGAVELPISPVIGDRAGRLGPLAAARPRQWPGPLLIAELLARSSGFVGVSLHAATVASVFGVPVLRPHVPGVAKYAALERLPGVRRWSGELAADLRALRAGVEGSAPIAALEAAVASHWDAVCEAARGAAPVDPVPVVAGLAVAAAMREPSTAALARRLAALEEQARDRAESVAYISRDHARAEAELVELKALLARRSVRAALRLADLARGRTREGYSG